MASKRPFSGPLRLVLIQSGKYDYAELDLTKPFQLVGHNGLGKTALISTLQYLYIDNQRDMRFGKHSWESSREFYFKGDTSYILFECQTPTGIYTIGVRGKGPASGYDLERFYYKGPYEQSDYITDGAVRRWEQSDGNDVRSTLAVKDFKEIKDTAAMRALLGATDADSKQTLGLVPIIDSHDYRLFRQTFQRLLQLKEIKQDDMKALLSDCAKLTTGNREIDLTKICEGDIRKIEQGKSEVARLKTAKPTVDKIQRLSDREVIARSIAFATVQTCEKNYADYAARYQKELDVLYTGIQVAEAELSTLRTELNEQGSRRDVLAGERALVHGKLENLSVLEAAYDGYLPDIEQQYLSQMEAEFGSLSARLVNMPTASVEDLEVQISRITTDLEAKETALEHNSALLINWLRERMDPNEVATIGSLLSPRLLESVIGQDVSPLDEMAFVSRIRRAARKCEAGKYSDDAVEIAIPQKTVDRVLSMGDTKAITSEISSLLRDKKSRETDLETLRETADLRQRHKTLESELRTKRARAAEYLQLLELQAASPALKGRLEELDQALTVLGEETQMIVNKMTEESNKVRAGEAEQRRLSTEKSAVEAEASRMPFARGDRPDPSPVADTFIRDEFAHLPLNEQIRLARSKCAEAENILKDLETNISLLDSLFAGASFEYDASAPIEIRLASVQSEIAGIPAIEERLNQEWIGVLVLASSGFQSILTSLDKIRRQVQKFNTELGKIEFSSIAGVQLKLLRNEQAIADYERHAQTGDTTSLFDSPDADARIDAFRLMLTSRPKLVLGDLYSLSCEIHRKDGKRNHYEDFDAVESTGTTIVLKVTLNLLALRDLLVSDKARIPFYLDEVHALDTKNLRNIIDLSERLGFVGIFAAPHAAIGPRRFIHLVPSEAGRLVVTERHTREIIKEPENPVSAGANA